MNEKETRKEIIDRRLLAAGWKVEDASQVVVEYGVLTRSLDALAEDTEEYGKRTIADYLLLGRDGKALAVVEAKKTSSDAEEGQEQARKYCYGIRDQDKVDLPLCLYTNGNDIFMWELEEYPPSKVQSFPTLDDLERYQFLRKSRQVLAKELINTNIAGRDYQVKAIRSVMESIEKRHRMFLLVMATGTGKTRTSIALIEALMRAKWVERVLFLVDRVTLKEQALDAFKEHLPNEPRWPQSGDKQLETNRRIYVDTYPSMLNTVRDEKNRPSSHFFDLIIIDESHRSIYNVFQEILKYFDALTLGLTATPTDIIDHNTFKLFECADGLPTFAYSYEEAVENIPPYLCNFQVMKIATRFQEEGMNKRTIALEDQKRLIQEGKDIEEIVFEGTDLEKTVVNHGTNALIVREFMEECIKDQNGVLPGKTIFFCMSKKHARRMQKVFDALYPEYRGELARVMVSGDERVHGEGGLLDQFKRRDMPRIALSVGMLDTGVDVREVTNLVFAKPVYSYTRFWQMIGRGTRLLEPTDLKPWCLEKDVFLIMDCWDNFKYFKLNPEGVKLKAQIPLPVKLFGERLDRLSLAFELGRKDIVIKESGKLRKLIEQLPAQSVVIRDAAEALRKVESDSFWDEMTDSKLTFLRQVIQPLMRTVSELAFKPMRFEREVVELSLAHLAEDQNRFEALQQVLTEKIAALPLTVNTVAKEKELIRRAQTSYYWSTSAEEDFEQLIERIAPLMEYVQTTSTVSAPAEFNLRDELARKEFVEFGPQHESITMARYREMVEDHIISLRASSPLLQKIEQGGQLTVAEADALALELLEIRPHITVDLLRKVYDHRKAELQAFLRHILGVEVLKSYDETVSVAFDQFIREHSYLSTRQLEFLNAMRTFLIDKGEVTKRHLTQAPFTRIHPEGILGVFSEKQINDIMHLIENAA